MIYYSDKHDTLNRGAVYLVNGARQVYLGFTHVDGGNYYSNKTAQELDRATVQPAKQ